MSLKVIGAGFGRTGTLSMKAALEQLGYDKCHHMAEVMPDGDQRKAWNAIGHGEAPDWNAVFEGFQASVDFPSCSYWRELSAEYPEARVILTTRDFDGWYESARETIYAFTRKIPGWLTVIPMVRTIRDMTNATVWDKVFDGRFEDKEYARKVFEQHEAEVKATIPADRLLVFHPKQGWEPLCAFLGQPIPDMPFPNVNDRDQFKKMLGVLDWINWLPWIAGGLVALGAIAAAFAFQ